MEILFSGLQNRGGEIGVVNSIGKMLSLHANCVMLSVYGTVFTPAAAEKPRGVNLHALHGCFNVHTDICFGAVKTACIAAVQYKIVVKTLGDIQTAVIEPAAQNLGRSKIKGSAFHTGYLAGGNGAGTAGGVIIGVYLKLMAVDCSAVMPSKVEIGVVGEIHHRIFV